MEHLLDKMDSNLQEMKAGQEGMNARIEANKTKNIQQDESLQSSNKGLSRKVRGHNRGQPGTNEGHRLGGQSRMEKGCNGAS
jgi:hypothetical protein